MKKRLSICFLSTLLMLFSFSAMAQKTTCPKVMKDIEGNEYKVVQIGQQCWMAEDMRTKTMPNGKAITFNPEGKNPSNYKAGSGYYWYFEVNDEISGHNVLYPWSTAAGVDANTGSAQVQGICPDGWHLPSATEYQTMFNVIDPSIAVGKDVKNNTAVTSNNKLAIKLSLPQGTGEGYGHWLHYKGPGYVGPNDGTPTSNGGGGSDFAHVANTPGYNFPNNNDKDFNASGFSAKPKGYLDRKNSKAYQFNGTLNLWTSYGSGATNYAVCLKIAMNQTGYLPCYYSDVAKDFYSVRCVKAAELACATPKDLKVSDIKDDSFILTWKPGADETTWMVTVNGKTYTASEPKLVVEGLAENTKYDVQVASVCGTDHSDAATVSATTLAKPCPAPTLLEASKVTANSITLTWAPGADETAWTVSCNGKEFEAKENTITISDLEEGTKYTVAVKALCPENKVNVESVAAKLDVTTEALPCPKPMMPSADDITATSAKISWVPATLIGATVSEIEYSVKVNGKTYKTTETSVVVTGLTENTEYDVEITQLCNANKVNKVSDALTYKFKTAALPCAAPQNVKITDVTVNSAVVTWTAAPGTTSWTVECNGVTKDVNTTSYTINGLEEETEYTVKVYTNCPDNSLNKVSEAVEATFETASKSCVAPENISVKVTDNSADLAWTAGEGQTSWKVVFNGETYNVATPEFSIDGLEEATDYQVSIYANCEKGKVSPALTTTVTTAATVCPVPTAINFQNITSTSAIITWQAADNETEWEVVVDGKSYTTNVPTLTVSGLKEKTTYEVVITSKCAYNKVNKTSAKDAAAKATFTTGDSRLEECCFWLENLNPQVIENVSNAPEGKVVLDNTLNPAVKDNIDVYKVHFVNNGCLDPNAKVSLEWKLYYNGKEVNEDLSKHADFRIYTKYNNINVKNGDMSNPDLCNSIKWLGGTVRDGHGICCPKPNDPKTWVEGYPGAMHPGENEAFTYQGNQYDAPGVTFGNDYLSLDYFNLPFFESTEHVIVIKWKNTPNAEKMKYSLVVGLRERYDGTDFPTLYWDENQSKYIGGHQSCCKDIVAQDSIYYYHTAESAKEICEGTSFTYGRPAHEYTEAGEYTVVFGDSVCGHFKLDHINYFTLDVRHNPVVDVINPNPEICYNEVFGAKELAACVAFEKPAAEGLTSSEIQWSLDGVNFSTVVPTPSTAVGTQTFYVRQVNTYANYTEIVDPSRAILGNHKDVVICEGPASVITLTIHPLPEAPVVTPNVYYCLNGEAVAISTFATPSEDCELHWSLNKEFNPEIAGTTVPATDKAGITTYYVYQKNVVTGCFDITHYSTVTVEVYALPVVEATASKGGCEGTQVTLTATPDTFTTYAWEQVIGVKDGTTWISGKETAKAVVEPVAGTYTYEVSVSEYHTAGDITCYYKDTTDAVIIYPIPVAPAAIPAVNICNEETIADTTLTLKVGKDGTTCKWYLDGKLVYTGAEYKINLADIRPATNVDKTVTYFVTSYNEETTCETAMEDATPVVINFHQTPEIALTADPKETVVCPGTVINLTVNQIQNPIETEEPYTYTWGGDVKPANEAKNVIATTNECNKEYMATVYMTDANGCKSLGLGYKVIAQDKEEIVLNPASVSATIFSCDIKDIPAAFTTVDEFKASQLTAITDNCENLEKIESKDEDITPADDICNIIVKRTYTLTDHCGNTATFVQTFTLTDNEKPVINRQAPIVLTPVKDMKCTYNVPAREVLIDSIKNYVKDNCTEADYLLAHARFVFNGTETQFDGAKDIFADENINVVNGDVVLIDKCGNIADIPTFVINRPEPMTIDLNAITISKTEICLHDSVSLHFNSDFVRNADAPYTYEWSATPNDGSIINYTTPDAIGVPQYADMFYTYKITVTDKYGCVASQSATPVWVNNLPTVTVVPDIRNGAEFPLCPNYGVLTVQAIAKSNIPNNPSLSYDWSGESVNIQSHIDTTGVYIIPKDCNREYAATVLVTNVKGCKATYTYTFEVRDNEAPQIVEALKDSTVTIELGCKMYVPNFIELLNRNNVVDNCYPFGELTFSQEPKAGTEMTQNTDVVITLKDYCGNVGYAHVNALVPTDALAVEITTDNDAFCLGGEAELTANVKNSVEPVKYAWSNGDDQVSTVVEPTEAGNPKYTVTVTDGRGCTASDDIVLTVYPNPVEKDIVLNPTPNHYCDNDNNVFDGTISATLTEGYMYRMAGDNTWRAADYVYTGLKDGTYYFDVKSDHDCVTPRLAKVNVAFEDVSVIAVAEGTENIRCKEPFTGVITVTNVVPGYSYEIIDLPNSKRVCAEGQTSIVYEGMNDGKFTVHVVTDKFCEYDIKDIIVDRNRVYPAAPDYTVALETSCEHPNGALTINNAVPGYVYTFSGSPIQITATSNQVTFINLSAGKYFLTVTTPNDCEKTFYDITIDADHEIPADVKVTTTPNHICDLQTITADGTMTVALPSLVKGYTYVIGEDTITYDGTNEVVFKHLAEGEYTLYVISDLGCKAGYPHTVNFEAGKPAKTEYAKYDNTVCMPDQVPACISITPISYNGRVVITKPNANYDYTLTSVTGAEVKPLVPGEYSNLVPGEYVLTTLNTLTGCTDTVHITIFDAPVPVVFAKDEIKVSDRTSCTSANGCIVINVDPDYHYFICDVADEALTVASNLDAGFYTIYKINNVTNCFEDTVVEIKLNTPAYEMEVAVTPDNLCFDLTGNGTITIKNADADQYDFRINESSYVHSTVFENLNEGEYTITARNIKTQCETAIKVTVRGDYKYPEFKVIAHDNTLCKEGEFDGYFEFDPATDYSYVVDNGYEYVENANLPAGRYIITATVLSTGCAAEVEARINDNQEIPEVNVAVNNANYNCYDKKNGKLVLTNKNAKAIDVTYYVVPVSADGVVPAEEDILHNTTGIFDELNSGVYDCYIITDKGCESEHIFATVIDSAYIDRLEMYATANTMCKPTFEHPGNGTIVVTYPPVDVKDVQYYTYSFYDAAGSLIDVNYFEPISRTMYHLAHGDYRVVVKDLRTGCEYTDYITVPLDNHNTTVDYKTTPNHNCVAPFDGTITLTAVNPYIDAVYYYSLDGVNYTKNNVFTGLKNGEYPGFIFDSVTNCVYELGQELIEVGFEPYEITINPEVKDNTACKAPFNGVVTLTASSTSGSEEFAYRIDTVGAEFQTSNVFEGLAAGTYNFTVKDMVTGCTEQLKAVVVPNMNDNAPIVSIYAEGNNNEPFSFCRYSDGRLVADVTSKVEGDNEFTYLWMNDCFHPISETESVSIFTDSVYCCNYTLLVTSKLTGCEQTVAQKICVLDAPKTYFTVNGTSVIGNTYELCDDQEAVICVENRNLASAVWSNGHKTAEGESEFCFIEAANTYKGLDTTITYCVLVTDNYGCTSTGNLNVHYNMTYDVTVDTTFCAIEDVDFMDFGTTYKFNPDGKNEYKVDYMYETGMGCDSLVHYNITLQGLPVVVVDAALDAALKNYICDGSQYCTDNIGRGLSSSKYADTYGWQIAVDVNRNADWRTFDITREIPFTADGAVIRPYAANTCGTAYGEEYTLKVRKAPEFPAAAEQPAIVCAGNAAQFATPNYILNNGTLVKSGWVYADDHTKAFDPTAALTAEQNGKQVQFFVTNECGTAYSSAVTLKVEIAPVASNLSIENPFCAGDVIVPTVTVSATNYPSVNKVDTLMKLGDNVYTSEKLTYADNGKKFILTVENCCGKSSVEKVVVVNDKPVIDNDMVVVDGCIADASLTAPTVNWRGNKGTETWQIKQGANWVATTASVVNDILNNGSEIRYYAKNDCGEAATSPVKIKLSDVPVFVKATFPLVYCAGEEFGALTASTHYSVNWNNADGCSISMYYSDDTKLTNKVMVKFGDELTLALNGKYLSLVAKNACGADTAIVGQLVVNDTAAVKIAGKDVLCEGETADYKVTRKATNKISVTATTGDIKAVVIPCTTCATTGDVEVVDTVRVTALTATMDGASSFTVTSTPEGDCQKADLTKQVYVVGKAKIASNLPDVVLCDGQTLELPAAADVVTAPYNVDKTSVTNRWEISYNNGDSYTLLPDEYVVSYRKDDKALIRYSYNTTCADASTNAFKLTVYEKPYVESVSEITLCKDQPVEISFTSNYNVTMTPEDKGLTVDNEKHVISGLLENVAANEKFNIVLTAAQTPCTSASATIKVTVADVPEITVTSSDPKVCIGENITVNYSITDNSAAATAATHISLYDFTAKEYAEPDTLVLPLVATAAHDLSKIIVSASNNCGAAENDTVEVAVYGKATIAALSPVRACAGDVVTAYVSVPVVSVPTQSTKIAVATWKLDGNVVEATETINDKQAHTLSYSVTTQCGTTESNVVNLIIDSLPEITGTVAPVEICDGSEITLPATPAVTCNAEDCSSTKWIVKTATADEAFDATKEYSTDYDGASLCYVVNNVCGADTTCGSITVHPLPVPHMLADTVICLDGTASFKVVDPNPTSIYSWFMDGNPTTFHTSGLLFSPHATYTPNATDNDTITVYVKEYDVHGCVSKTAVNDTYDPILSDRVTVWITDNPQFIFKDMAGNKTRHIPAETQNGLTKYTWQINNPCYDEDELVFVEFVYKFNGERIENNLINDYLKEQIFVNNDVRTPWTSSDSINWYSSDHSKHLKHVTLYNTAYPDHADVQNGNHYPNSNMGLMNDNVYDDYYLHFLGNREVTKTFADFLKAGTYTVEYTLYATSQKVEFYHEYSSDDNSKRKVIGGHNSIVDGAKLTVLAEDVFTINVSGEDAVVDPFEGQIEIAPIAEVADQADVKLYPNPAKDQVKAYVTGLVGETKVRISNVAGKVVSTETINITSDGYVFTYDLSDLTPGIYFVTVSTEQGSVSKKLVITK